jgi:tRNA pseudouridine55 synthase
MLIAVDKPLELTSFDIVKRMKHVFPNEKIGHSGTLDPKATGLMVLGIGKDTKKLTSLIGLDKVYETVIDFSKMSDTWDMGYRERFEIFPLLDNGAKGILKNHLIVPAPSLQQLQDTLHSLIPKCELPLPAFSAKKKEGKRLYTLARSGQEIAETKLMKIHHFEILGYSFPELHLRLAVGS